MAERTSQLILASASAVRQQLLRGAGLEFRVEPADIDEPAVANGFASMSIAERAKGLAGAKALQVSRRRAGELVIGADQMLELDGEVLSKVSDRVAARRVLTQLRDRTHRLHSGVALARDDKILWDFVEAATLHVRMFSETWLDAYLDRAGDALTKSVGCYQLEGLGVQLFERIDGDYHTILGLPLVPLLAELRRLGNLEE